MPAVRSPLVDAALVIAFALACGFLCACASERALEHRDDDVDDGYALPVREVQEVPVAPIPHRARDVDARLVAPVPLPPGPWQDAPAHAPPDFLRDLVTSIVVGILDVSVVPLTAIPHVLSGGKVPMVPFIEPPLLTGQSSLFDDALLDDDEWRAEVARRALVASRETVDLTESTSSLAWAALAADAPPWAKSPALPQPLDALAVFQATPRTHRGDVDGESLVCRVEVHRSFDTFGAADLLVRVAFGFRDVTAHNFRGPDDHNSFAFVVPDVHLAVGEKLKLSVVDVDPVSEDWIGAVAVRYAGGPVVLADDNFKAECRVRSAEEERASRGASFARAEDALTALGHSRAPTRALSADAALRDRIVDIASAGGWRTEEATRAVEGYGALRDAWRRSRSRSLDHGASEIALGAVRIHATSTQWSASGLCTIHLAARVDAHNAIDVQRLVKGAVIVDALGRTAPAAVASIDERDGDGREDVQTFTIVGDGFDDESPFSLEWPNDKVVLLPVR